MSLTAIVNLAERLLNNSSNQSGDTNLIAKPASAATSAVANAGDQFTPSQASEADAGLFQVTQFRLFTAAAAQLLSQANPPANPAAPPAQTTNASAQNTAQLTEVPVVNATAAVTTNPTTTSSASVEDQLQSLNTALAALGLDPAELAQVDRIASLIQDYNPAAFTSLVHQLEATARAQAPTKANAPQAPANPTPIKKSANA